jgi:hypothetical protein
MLYQQRSFSRAVHRKCLLVQVPNFVHYDLATTHPENLGAVGLLRTFETIPNTLKTFCVT